MVNEGAFPYNQQINETLFHAVRFRTPAAGGTGHSTGSFRCHFVSRMPRARLGPSSGQATSERFLLPKTWGRGGLPALPGRSLGLESANAFWAPVPRFVGGLVCGGCGASRNWLASLQNSSSTARRYAWSRLRPQARIPDDPCQKADTLGPCLCCSGGHTLIGSSAGQTFCPSAAGLPPFVVIACPCCGPTLSRPFSRTVMIGMTSIHTIERDLG